MDVATLFNPASCANIGDETDDQRTTCQELAGKVCSSCKLVQYCSKKCQGMDWPRHKRICKSDLMKSVFVPVWIKEARRPCWMSDTDVASNFGINQYLWGNMPALDILKMNEIEDINGGHRDVRLLFAASGDIRNVVQTITDGLPNEYVGTCMLVINDINFMITARNTILLLTALSLEPDEAAITMMHLWYSAMIPHEMLTRLSSSVLRLIDDVCDKVKDKESSSLQAKTFLFGQSSVRLVLQKYQWDELKKYFSIPQDLTYSKAQEIRRRCMLAPERTDYLHRALCNQPPAFRVATIAFREDGILLPHGLSRKEFDTPNPTLFHDDLVWPMKDDASPLEGWDYHSYNAFASRATNDIIGSLFFYLRDTLLRFCRRIKDTKVKFHLFNMDARVLPNYLSVEEANFDRIEVSNICDRGYVGPERTLYTFGPLLASKSINPKATLLMLFLNAVSEVYHCRSPEDEGQRFKQAQSLIKRFIPVTPTMMMKMMTDGMGGMSTPELIRLSSCYTMFGDFDEAFGSFLEDVQMHKLAAENDMKVKKVHTIVKPWPLRITSESTSEEFDIRCASSHLGSERYIEFEKC